MSEQANRIESQIEEETNLDVLLHGAYFCDLIFGGLPEMPQLGRDLFSTSFEIVPGGAFYTAQALHRLGLRTGWVCDVGTDMFSRYVIEAAQEAGMDTSFFVHHDGPMRRLAAVFSFSHDRGFISYTDGELNSSVPLAMVERLRPRCLLLSHLGYWRELPLLSELPQRRETLVYMDCQDSELTLETPGLCAALRHVDVFSPNQPEALHLTGESTVEAALARLAEVVPTVVIKCGSQGAIGQRGEELSRVGPLPVTAVDTTGAGDCFNAGCVYGLLHGASLEDCLRYGNIVGGLSTTGAGGANVPSGPPDLAAYFDEA